MRRQPTRSVIDRRLRQRPRTGPIRRISIQDPGPNAKPLRAVARLLSIARFRCGWLSAQSTPVWSTGLRSIR